MTRHDGPAHPTQESGTLGWNHISVREAAMDTSPTAPDLLEVAQNRWDVERVPVVTWDEHQRTFWLVDPGDAANRIRLATFEAVVSNPAAVANALAETVASCDFPPTEAAASLPRVTAALRVTGFADLALVADPQPDDIGRDLFHPHHPS